MKRNVLLLPLLIFLLIAAALLWQLARNAQGDDPTNLESALTGKPVPAFRLESLETPGQYYQAEVLTQGKPVLLNVWATWCPTCRAEHQYLNQLSWATWCPTCRAEHQYLNRLAAQGIRVVGLNYKDDRAKAVAWLKELGNPYALSLSDSDGMLGLDLGVYGAPETFLIDGRGIIRYRHAGDLNARVWESELKPLWDRYSREAAQ
ncbi:thiol:disulfide interChange protein DsbE [Salmonella enterica subsp. enterica serovar Agona str. 67.H.09]|nr:DsbE family thiol:disulfide interchange protein [Salmonella enterica]CCU20026.1 thiol:disulfide interChange protein DsbE [Salmonella enterica subsp. enterica serovar Agona str. 67.H.09]